MTTRTGIRALAALAAAVGLLAPAGLAQAAASRALPYLDQGVVQSASSSGLVLRELDGSVVDVPLAPGVVVRLNGQPASIADVRPGYVAIAARRAANGPALLVRAFGRPPVVRDLGIIVAVSPTSITLLVPGQGQATFPVTATTAVELRGLPASLGDLKPGMPAMVRHVAGGAALLIRARGRGSL